MICSKESSNSGFGTHNRKHDIQFTVMVSCMHGNVTRDRQQWSRSATAYLSTFCWHSTSFELMTSYTVIFQQMGGLNVKWKSPMSCNRSCAMHYKSSCIAIYISLCYLNAQLSKSTCLKWDTIVIVSDCYTIFVHCFLEMILWLYESGVTFKLS